MMTNSRTGSGPRLGTIAVVMLAMHVGVCRGQGHPEPINLGASGNLGGKARVPPAAEVDASFDPAHVLAQGESEFPAAAAGWWTKADGLPQPGEAQFVPEALRLLQQFSAHAPVVLNTMSLWDIEYTASRQLKCLAYLATEGNEPGRKTVAKLCAVQAARLQWLLPISNKKTVADNRLLCAAVAGLTMTGDLLWRRAEEGSAMREVGLQWVRTGAGQFATYGTGSETKSKGKTSSRRKERSSSDVRALTTMLKRVTRPGIKDLHGTDEAFFGQLDLSRAELREVALAVAEKEWPKAKQAYVAALAKRFSKERSWPNIHFWQTAVDLAEADDICRNVFILQAHMFRRYDFGDRVDWAKVIDDDIESRVWMNAHSWMLTLLSAYQATGDDKYVAHLCRLFRSWYESSQPPLVRDVAQWRTLEAGGRVGQKWGVVLLALADNPRFQREALFEMARSMLDHGKYLAMYAKGGGNWLQVEASGLACVGLLFPEFKLSPLFYETGMNRLVWVNARSFLPDGFQSECSLAYHRFPLTGIAGAVRLAKHLNRPVPESLLRQYEAGLDVLQYAAYPDGTLPQISDCSPKWFSASELLRTGSEVFGREDFRWFVTGGKEGQPPAETSHDFTHAGFCVMRDKWGADGQMLLFDAGFRGTSHQHEDKLNFVFYGGGRELIGDPGIYAYKRDAFLPYWRGSLSHNTMAVDGRSQDRALGPAETIPDPDRRFVRGADFDFAAGWYRHPYSLRLVSKPPEPIRGTKPISDVQHQRCILYAKGRYAVVCDRVLGKGEHVLEVLFHPAPVVATAGTKSTARPVALEVRADGAVVTTEPEHANVALLPARMQGVEIRDLIGQKEPARGWYALYGISPSHDIVYRTKTDLPWHFETVVEPLPTGRAEPRRVTSQPVQSAAGKSCVALRIGGDLFLLSYEGSTEITCGDVTFHGTALLLRSDGRRYVQADLVDGTSLRIGRRQVFSGEAMSGRTLNRLDHPEP